MVLRCTGRVRIASAVLLACAGLAHGASAEPATTWYHRDWQTDDGLPAANVTGIAQTRDGFLWLATQAGLARFDGVQFEEIPIPVKHARLLIRVMLCDQAENLWLAQDRGVVVRIGLNAAQVFNCTNGIADALPLLPLQMVESPDHAIWIAYANRSVFHIAPDGIVNRITTAENLPEDGVASLAVDAHGVLWCAKGTRYGFFRGGSFQEAGRLAERNAQILGSRDGSLWFCGSSQVWKADSNSAPAAVARFDGDSGRVKPSVLYEDSAKRLWIGTAADGLFLFDNSTLRPVETSQNNIRTIMEDHEGNIWVGTEGGGINRLRQKEIELRGREDGLPFETVRSLCEDRSGDLWVITQDGAVTKLPGGDWSNGQKIENWPGGQAHCVVGDKSGAVWFGTYQHGLLRRQEGHFSSFTLQDGLRGLNIRSLMADTNGSLWIGLESEHLVQNLHDNQFRSFQLPADCGPVRAMAQDAAGTIWLGTLDGQLFHVEQGKLAAVALPRGAASRPIRCLSALPDGTVWIGSAVSGLCRAKAGKISQIGRSDGLFDANICAMMPDEFGRMWFGSDRGIFYVPLSQLNDFADGKTQRVQSAFFGRDAGLPSLQAYYGYWPGAVTDKSGEILFPTHSGIAVVHPERVHPNLTPPEVVIQSVLLDGQRVAMGKNGLAENFPPGHRRIEVNYTAPSFVAPEQLRFRYRLEGWNEEWSEESSARTAIFSRLPAGAYRFRVIVGNNFGVWNETGATVPFVVAPFFWQTWWFLAFVVALFTSIVAAFARYLLYRRVRVALKKVAAEAALQRERTRIAQDMHDELGARFTQISLLGELSRNALAEPDKARELLGQISGAAQTGVRSLDEIVWAVNPRNDTLPDLLDYTGQYARDFLAAANLPCRLEFPVEVPSREIPGNVRHAIFHIVKEALNNVVKHARASRVKMSVELKDSEMLWVIEDDGQGFAQAPVNAVADGLRNINHRAAALHGWAEINSIPGAGTRILLRIPLKN